MDVNEEIRLTAHSKGAGCGCKISPQVLEQILGNTNAGIYKNLLVGNDTRDDAAVYDIGNNQAIISTADFFTPIVDDAFLFGKVAAANAISDVYAMGGRPIMALGLLGWPVDKLPAALAEKVMAGARAICAQAGIPLAGGHSIDSSEPLFGLCVTGLVEQDGIKRNNTAIAGDWLLLTKPLGTGILTTAAKRSLLLPEHEELLYEQLSALNSIGSSLGSIEGVHAMTDVTGFGLSGHLLELTNGSGLSAEVYYSKIPVMEGVSTYLAQRIIPDATFRNWNACQQSIGFEKGVNVMEAFQLLPDPQTNGGLLLAVADESLEAVKRLLEKNGLALFARPIGKLLPAQDKSILVRP